MATFETTLARHYPISLLPLTWLRPWRHSMDSVASLSTTYFQTRFGMSPDKP